MAQPVEGRLPAAAPERPTGRRLELRVDPLDLGQADGVDPVGRQVERRVGADEPAVRLIAAGHAPESGPVVRSRAREDPLDEDVPIAHERGTDLLTDDRLERRREALPVGLRPAGSLDRGRGQQRPRVDGLSEQVVELVDHLADRALCGDHAVGQGGQDVRGMPVDVRAHRPPAAEQPVAVGRRLDGLVGGNVEEPDLGTLERVD